MNGQSRLASWFDQLDRHALAEAGGKGANLAVAATIHVRRAVRTATG